MRSLQPPDILLIYWRVYNSIVNTSKGVLFLPPSDAYVRSFLYLLYTLIKLYYTKALSNQASSLAPDWILLLWGPRIPALWFNNNLSVFFKKCKSEAAPEPAMAPGFPLRKASFLDHEDTESSSLSSLSSSSHFLALLFVLQPAFSPGRSIWLLRWLLCLEGSPHSYPKGSHPYKSLLKWYLSYLPW